MHIRLQDDLDRENEGDLIGVAQYATKDSVAFMLRHTSGVICAPLTRARANELRLPLMVPDNQDPYRTAFTVTVDYRHGTTTGISAADRAITIKSLADDSIGPDNFTRPGHIFPLLAQDGGVLIRGGHTEAGVDLARLAGAGETAYLCEVYNHETGEMSRLPELRELSKQLQLPLISIADMQQYRYRREVLVEQAAGSDGGGGLATGSVRYRSLYNDQVYDCRYRRTSTDAAPTVAVRFEGIGGTSALNAAAADLTITVSQGCYWENVKGKEAAHIGTIGKPEARAAAGPAPEAQPTAYDNQYPDPPDASSSAASTGFALHAVCDRVCAEIAQVIASVLTGKQPAPMLATGAESGGKTGTGGFAAVTLLVLPGVPLARVWKFGVAAELLNCLAK